MFIHLVGGAENLQDVRPVTVQSIKVRKPAKDASVDGAIMVDCCVGRPGRDL